MGPRRCPVLAMQKATRILILSCWGALFSPFVVNACVIFHKTVEVGRQFRVRVMDRGRPVSGLLVSFGSGGGTIDEVTDADGYAQFEGLFPGSFFVTTQYGGDDSTDRVNVHVSDSAPADAVVQMAWPGRTPLTVRSASGTMRGPNFYPSLTQGRFSVSLLEGRSARVIETTESDTKGRFSFTTKVPPGIYYVRLNSSDPDQIHGAIPIEISAEAADDGLDVDLGWTDCGLVYAQNVKEPDLKISKICGDIADVGGGVVAKAQVLLFSDNNDAKLLSQTHSDSSGQFAFKELREGTYQLIVASLGFLPSLRTVHLEPSNSEGCPQPIHIRQRPQ